MSDSCSTPSKVEQSTSPSVWQKHSTARSVGNAPSISLLCAELVGQSPSETYFHTSLSVQPIRRRKIGLYFWQQSLGTLPEHRTKHPKAAYLEAPGLTPSISQLSLLLRILRMVSACSLVKLALLFAVGRFPPLSHKSTMDT